MLLLAYLFCYYIDILITIPKLSEVRLIQSLRITIITCGLVTPSYFESQMDSSQSITTPSSLFQSTREPTPEITSDLEPSTSSCSDESHGNKHQTRRMAAATAAAGRGKLKRAGTSLKSLKKVGQKVGSHGTEVARTLSHNSSRSKRDTPDPSGEYENPLHNVGRWQISVRAYALRAAAALALGFSNFSSRPASRSIWLNMNMAASRNSSVGIERIRVDIWLPPHGLNTYNDSNILCNSADHNSFPVEDIPRTSQVVSTPARPQKPRPALINFHGGGYILGQGTDDAAWCSMAAARLGAIVFSVNYRLAPAYPFPIAVEDCTDAILQITKRADDLGVDKNCILVSGFSAGGNLALASWVLMQTPERWGYQLPVPPPSIVGFILFYPPLDWTQTRPEKRETVKQSNLTLPPNMTDLFDASYLYPPLSRKEREDPRLSPGLVSDEVLESLPSIHLCLCEHDMLAAEGLRFADRLRKNEKQVSVRLVENEQHAWDKQPSFSVKSSIDTEYQAALLEVEKWLV